MPGLLPVFASAWPLTMTGASGVGAAGRDDYTAPGWRGACYRRRLTARRRRKTVEVGRLMVRWIAMAALLLAIVAPLPRAWAGDVENCRNAEAPSTATACRRPGEQGIVFAESYLGYMYPKGLGRRPGARPIRHRHRGRGR